MSSGRGGAWERVAMRTCGVTLIVVAGVALVAPRNTWFAFDRWIVTGVACAGVLAVATAVRWAPGSAPVVPVAARRTWATVLLGGLGVTAISGVLTAAARYHVGWDAQHVARSAVALGLEDSPWPEPRDNYFARFPNSITLLQVQTLVVRLGDRWGWTGGRRWWPRRCSWWASSPWRWAPSRP